MDELIKLVTQKVGINEKQAKAAVETVLGFLKQKLPPPLASQLDALIGAPISPDVLKGVEGLLGNLGNMSDKK